MKGRQFNKIHYLAIILNYLLFFCLYLLYNNGRFRSYIKCSFWTFKSQILPLVLLAFHCWFRSFGSLGHWNTCYGVEQRKRCILLLPRHLACNDLCHLLFPKPSSLHNVHREHLNCKRNLRFPLNPSL